MGQKEKTLNFTIKLLVAFTLKKKKEGQPGLHSEFQDSWGYVETSKKVNCNCFVNKESQISFKSIQRY